MFRRSFVLLSAAAGPASLRAMAFAPGDFWNDKQPAGWSEKDIQKLLTHSPWAKEVSADTGGVGGGSDMGGRSGGRSGGGGGMGGGGMGGGSVMNGGGGGPVRGADREGGGMGGGRPEMKAIVRWESARPVREATHKELPATLAGNYILSVTGLRMGQRGLQEGRRSEGAEPGPRMEERLLQAAQLQRKSADPIYPSHVQTAQVRGVSVLFFVFPKGSQPIQASDKEVIFHLAIGRMELKAKFALKACCTTANRRFREH